MDIVFSSRPAFSRAEARFTDSCTILQSSSYDTWSSGAVALRIACKVECQELLRDGKDDSLEGYFDIQRIVTG